MLNSVFKGIYLANSIYLYVTNKVFTESKQQMVEGRTLTCHDKYL
jgi:hypothetical protein